MTRDEYIAAFRNYIAHPFGGNGAPFGSEAVALFDEFLKLPPPPKWKAERLLSGDPGYRGNSSRWKPAYSEDDLVILKVACMVRADLAATCLALGDRAPLSVVRTAYRFKPKIVPPTWSYNYSDLESRK